MLGGSSRALTSRYQTLSTEILIQLSKQPNLIEDGKILEESGFDKTARYKYGLPLQRVMILLGKVSWTRKPEKELSQCVVCTAQAARHFLTIAYTNLFTKHILKTQIPAIHRKTPAYMR